MPPAAPTPASRLALEDALARRKKAAVMWMVGGAGSQL